MCGRSVAERKRSWSSAEAVVVAYGFWIFLLSDIVMFSALFASYAVLLHANAGGPTGAELFNQSRSPSKPPVLASSYTCGLMTLAVNLRATWARIWVPY